MEVQQKLALLIRGPIDQSANMWRDIYFLLESWIEKCLIGALWRSKVENPNSNGELNLITHFLSMLWQAHPRWLLWFCVIQKDHCFFTKFANTRRSTSKKGIAWLQYIAMEQLPSNGQKAECVRNEMESWNVAPVRDTQLMDCVYGPHHELAQQRSGQQQWIQELDLMQNLEMQGSWEAEGTTSSQPAHPLDFGWPFFLLACLCVCQNQFFDLPLEFSVGRGDTGGQVVEIAL